MPEWGFDDVHAPSAPNTGAGGVSYEYHDFTTLLGKESHELMKELASVHTDMANLSERIAFLRANEMRRNTKDPERVMAEGSRDALSEKKWLILKILEGF